MQQLRKVLTQTTWANASDAINKNSDRIYEAITRVENATTKNKGYFETSNALLDTYPNPSVGDIAFVFNSANTIDTPYDVYKTAFSSTTNTYEWYDSGINAPFADVDINSVNDSIRDIEQQVDTLKDPRLPIICDANGRLGLNVGNGLYVDSNGDLCATQSIGGGGGSGSGGETYYAAAGISINEDNFISVKKDASLEFDNDNALRVGTGEGLVHNSQGKLSVNVGKGLVINDKTNAVEVEGYDAIKELPIAIQKKQDRLIKGSGIEITSENVINVDGSNLQVQLSTNAINDEDGKRIKTTYAKKEEVDGIYGAIEATNTTVASHTQSIGSLELNKQDKLEFGNGLSTVGNLVKVEDAVLKDIADNKKNIDTLSSSISGKQDKLTPSDGINLDEGKLSVHIGTGLNFDPLSSAVVVKVGAGVETDINQALTIKHNTTLTTDAEGQLGVNQGTITNIAASEVAKVVANAPANYDTLKEIADYIATDTEGAAQLSNRIGAVESALPNKQDTISDLSTIRSNAANGATAYGWGYHGTAGYAKKVKVGGTTYEADADAVVTLPAYPTSLPANGGNADTLDGYDSSHFATASSLDSKQDKLTFGDGFEQVNDTIKISTSYITEKIKGDGLILDESGRMSVDSGVAKGQIAMNISFPNPEQLINAGFLPTDYIASGKSLDDFLQAICKWAIHTYPAKGGVTLVGEISPTVSGTCILNLYSNEGYDSNTKLPRYCSGQYLSLDGYLYIFSVIDYKYSRTTMPHFSDIPTSLPANGGNADTLDGHDSSYFATKTELGNKQDTLAFGSGIARSNNTIWVDGSQLNVKYANSAGSVAWGNVSGRPSFGYGFEDVNGTIKISTSYIAQNIKGDGLVLGENGKISVDNSKVVTTSDDQTINGHKRFTGQLSIMGGHDLELCASDAAPNDAGDIIFCNNARQELGRIWLDQTGPRSLCIRYSADDYAKEVIHSANIAAYIAPLSVNYANSAGSVAWGNVSGRPSFGYGFEDVNGTIKISTSYITESIKGDGLVVNDSGLSVDSSKVVTVSGRQSIEGKDFTTPIVVVSHNDAKLAFNNTDNENKYQFISFQQNGVEYGTLGTLGDDELRWRTSKVLHEHNYAAVLDSAYLSKSGGTLTGGNNILTLQSTGASAFIAFDYGATRKATVGSYNGMAYIANETNSKCPRIGVNDAGKPQYWDSFTGDNKYDLLHTGNLGNGLQYNNNVVQLKLSTGLAIDDRGYIYVTGL